MCWMRREERYRAKQEGGTMLKEERELRMWIKGGADERSYKRNLSRLITAFRRAVIEDAIASYYDWEHRPIGHNVSFPDALRKGMRWRKTIRKGGKDDG